MSGKAKSISYCYNSGDVLGATTGGIIGYGYSIPVSNCNNTGVIRTTRSDGNNFCGEIAGYYYDSQNKYINNLFLIKETNANNNGAEGVDDLTEVMSMSNFLNLINSYVTTNNTDSTKTKLKTWKLENGKPVFYISK